MSRAVISCTWDFAPHLGEAEKASLWAAIPPYQRDARTKGVPQLGSGAIYPVPESDIVVADFPIPAHWPRAYGLDVGWKKTAAIWGAQNRDTGVIYLYSEHYRGEAEPVVHVESIKSRGAWVPGVIDPAARGRGQRDGQELLQNYLDLGLDIEPSQNAVEAGIEQCWQLFSAGRLKVFASLQHFLEEFRLYRRDENGKIVKFNDHLCDALRYLILSGRDRMRTAPVKKEGEAAYVDSGYSGTWMA